MSGTVDRIDRHRDTGAIRVIDYKTGKLPNRKTGQVEAAHRVTATPAVVARAAHLPSDSPAWHQAPDAKGKTRDLLWENLQLPLYVAALAPDFPDTLPQPCYLTIGETRKRTALEAWQGFSRDDADSALACTHWIIDRIDRAIFLPPAEAPRYDDYEPLAARGRLADLLPADLSLAPVSP